MLSDGGQISYLALIVLAAVVRGNHERQCMVPGRLHWWWWGGCPPSLVHGIVPWLLWCMAWYGVGALVKPTAAAIRRLCLRPVTWWEPAGSAGGPSRGCQASPTHTLGRTTPWTRIWTHSSRLACGGRAVFCMSLCSMQAFDYLQLIIFTNHCTPIWKRKPVRKIEGDGGFFLQMLLMQLLQTFIHNLDFQ